VAKITSTGFGSSGGGGGGGAPAPALGAAGGGGGGGAPAGPPRLDPSAVGGPAPVPAQVTVNLGDDAVMSGSAFRNLIDGINEQFSDGYTLKIAGSPA
jgi:hypothetical protein